jgi:hypothetical protein
MMTTLVFRAARKKMKWPSVITVQQDGAGPHRAKVVAEALKKAG